MKFSADMEEAADVPPACSPKLPDRSLVSLLPPLVEDAICSGGSLGCDGRPWASRGTCCVPSGVDNCNAGRSGLALDGICRDGMAGCKVGTLSATCDTPFTTGRTLGLGGMARPKFGLRLALLLRDPGIGGRSSGAGLDMVGGFNGGS
jgi:hypothetical protein